MMNYFIMEISTKISRPSYNLHADFFLHQRSVIFFNTFFKKYPHTYHKTMLNAVLTPKRENRKKRVLWCKIFTFLGRDSIICSTSIPSAMTRVIQVIFKRFLLTIVGERDRETVRVWVLKWFTFYLNLWLFFLSFARVNRTCFNECRDQTEWITFFKVIVAYVAAMQSKAKGKILKSVEKKRNERILFVLLYYSNLKVKEKSLVVK